MNQSASRYRDNLQDQLGDVTDRLGSASGDAMRRGRELTARAQESAEVAVREKPLTTLVAVAIMGFVLGALWRS